MRQRLDVSRKAFRQSCRERLHNIRLRNNPRWIHARLNAPRLLSFVGFAIKRRDRERKRAPGDITFTLKPDPSMFPSARQEKVTLASLRGCVAIISDRSVSSERLMPLLSRLCAPRATLSRYAPMKSIVVLRRVRDIIARLELALIPKSKLKKFLNWDKRNRA